MLLFRVSCSGFRFLARLFQRLSDERLRARAIGFLARSTPAADDARLGRAASVLIGILDDVIRHPDDDVLVVWVESQERRRGDLSEIVGVPNDFRLPIAENQLLVVDREDGVPG